MKTSRFFIVLGVCALFATIVYPLASTCSAESLPIVRVDPRAGDPDMPGSGFAIPFDYGDDYSHVPTSYVPSTSSTTSRRHFSWTRFAAVFGLRSYLGRQW